MKVTVRDALEFDVLADGLGFPEGPVFGADGVLYAVDVDRGVIWQMSGGEVSVAATPGAGPNGMALETPTSAVVANNGGFLWTEVNGFRVPIDFVTHTNEPPGFGGGWIERVDLVTGGVTVLHRDCDGRPFRGPNDLVFDEFGGIWFTDHGKGRRENVDRGGLYYVLPDGSAVVEKAFPLLGPNGVGLSPDGRYVYAAETHTGRLWSWELSDSGEIRPRSGNVSGLHGGTCVAATPYSFDSLAVEADGRIAVGAIADGIVVLTPDGEEAEVHPVPGDITTNIAFGGADGRRAVLTLSLSGRVVETEWPRPGLVVGPPRSQTPGGTP